MVHGGRQTSTTGVLPQWRFCPSGHLATCGHISGCPWWCWRHLVSSCQYVHVLVTQLCLTLCDPMDCSLLDSSVHGILQERILEWVAIPFSRGSSQPRDRTWASNTAGRFFTVYATRDAAKYPTMPRTAPQRRIILLMCPDAETEHTSFCLQLPVRPPAVKWLCRPFRGVTLSPSEGLEAA